MTGSLNTPRDAHSATLLASGEVLVTGGENAAGSILASAELFEPAKAFAEALERESAKAISAVDCCGSRSQRARSDDADRAAWIARAFRLEWLTVAWMTFEAAVAIASGEMAHSIISWPLGSTA